MDCLQQSRERRERRKGEIERVRKIANRKTDNNAMMTIKRVSLYFLNIVI